MANKKYRTLGSVLARLKACEKHISMLKDSCHACAMKDVKADCATCLQGIPKRLIELRKEIKSLLERADVLKRRAR